MKMIQRICALGKGLLLALLLGTALLGTSATSATSAKAASLNSGYGGCLQGWVCLWHGTNATGASFWGNDVSGVLPYCAHVFIGFTGVGSYANYTTYPVYVEYWNRQVDEYSLAFTILPGHTSSNTTSNSLAGRAAYARILNGIGCPFG